MSYREILNDYFLLKKEFNPSYSLRAFARDLNIPSSNLVNIINGKLGISKKRAENIADQLNFSRFEKVKFINLVQAESSRSKKERLVASEKLSRLHQVLNGKKVPCEDYFKYISEWYYFALLELITTKSFQSNIDWIAKRLKIKKDLAIVALERLERLGLMAKQDGEYLSKNISIETSFDIPSSSIKKHNTQILNKAKEALWDQPVEEREFGTLTIAASPEDLDFIKNEIREFKKYIDKKLIERAIKRGFTEEVYALCISFFKLTKDVEHEK
jgi:uncharacterized protein (TIGR02147 family)